MFDFFEKLAQFKAESKNGVLCIVVSSKGSTPRKAGSRMLVDTAGWVIGSVGGGALEKKVIAQAQDLLLCGGTALIKHELVKEHAMCCGGQVEVYMECLEHNTPLYIFGAGHVGLALGKAAQAVNFQVYLVDSRPEQLAHAKKLQKKAEKKIQKQIQEQIQEQIHEPSNYSEHNNFHLIDLGEEVFDSSKAIEAMQIPSSAYVCVMTHDHALDRALIEELGDRPVAYLGMIGSARKVALSNKYFLDNNLLTEEEIQRIYQPIGINIGAETPEEIAISVLAQLIDVRASLRKQQKHSGEMAKKITNKMLGSVSISMDYE